RDRVEHLDVRIDAESRAGQCAVIERDRQFEVSLLAEGARWAEEDDILEADFPVLGKSDAKTDEPVEFVPRSDLGMILLAPQVVPNARVDVEIIHKAVWILVEVEDQAAQKLRGQAAVGHQQSARRDVVVRE